MDGVISDTQGLHAQTESELLMRFGVKMSPSEITKKYAGVKTEDFFKDLLSRQGQPYSLDKLMAEKEERMLEHLDSIAEIPGAAQLIRTLSAQGFKLAVASASNAAYVNPALERLGVASYFQAIISGDMVKNGKPDPEIFLLAASKLGVAPSESVVIEDGVNGMKAAKAAGMHCIGLVGDMSGEYPTGNTVSKLSSITKEYIENLKK